MIVLFLLLCINFSIILLFIGIFVLSAKRTPFGTFGGKLRNLSPSDLSEIAVRSAIAASNVPADKIDTLVLGNVLHVHLFLLFLSLKVGL